MKSYKYHFSTSLSVGVTTKNPVPTYYGEVWEYPKLNKEQNIGQCQQKEKLLV